MINKGFEPVMNPEVLVGEAGGPPCGGGLIEDAGVGVNPVHAALEVCGIGAAAARNVQCSSRSRESTVLRLLVP
jgi:hypothetical protein